MPRRSGAVMHGYSIYTPNARAQVETNRPAKRRARALNEEVERRGKCQQVTARLDDSEGFDSPRFAP